ncbi:hypothetical protein pb186bvf_018855 [Paramecium bursaria]
MNKEDFENYFKSFWPQYKIGEERENKDQIFFWHQMSRSKLKSAYQEIKLLNHIVDHYQGCQKVIQLFDFFKSSLISQWKGKLNNSSSKSKLIMMNSNRFPIFTVNCEPVIKIKFYNQFESLLIDSARAISERYIQIIKQTTNEQQRLVQNIKYCEIKLQRARKQMGGISEEKERWDQQLQKLESRLNSFKEISSYHLLRQRILEQKILRIWLDKMKSNGLIYSENSNFVQILGQPIQITKWRINGLPSDQFFIENGIIMNRCLKYPLFIDIGLLSKMNNLMIRIILNLKQQNSLTMISQQYQTIPYLLVIVYQLKKFIINKQIFKNAGVQSFMVEDNIIQYNKQFNLLIKSRLSNPHYTPEILTKVTLINFTITQSGLEDQLLEFCGMREQPNIEEEMSRQILQQHKNQQELQKCQDQIIFILNDEEGIEVLQKSKEVSFDILERQKVSEFTKKKTDEARTQYKNQQLLLEHYYSLVLFHQLPQILCINIRLISYYNQLNKSLLIRLKIHSILGLEQVIQKEDYLKKIITDSFQSALVQSISINKKFGKFCKREEILALLGLIYAMTLNNNNYQKQVSRMSQPCQLFEFHPNAEITRDLNFSQNYSITSSLLILILLLTLLNILLLIQLR